MKIKTVSLVGVVAALCCALLAGCDASTVSGGTSGEAKQYPVVQSGPEESTITVSTSETVKVPADIGYVNVGVQSRGMTAEEAQQANAQTMTAVMDALKQQGVGEKDIETSNFNIMEDWENPGQYIVSNSVNVTIRNLDKTGEILDAAVAVGANNTYSLWFDIEDRDSVYVQALAKAMQSVGAKADALAQAGGYKIVRPLSIVEAGSSSYTPMMESYAMDAAAPMATPAPTPVTPGEIEVSASVTGTYVIE